MGASTLGGVFGLPMGGVVLGIPWPGGPGGSAPCVWSTLVYPGRGGLSGGILYGRGLWHLSVWTLPQVAFPHLDPRCLAMSLHCQWINAVCMCVCVYVCACPCPCACVCMFVQMCMCGEGRGGFRVFCFVFSIVCFYLVQHFGLHFKCMKSAL